MPVAKRNRGDAGLDRIAGPEREKAGDPGNEELAETELVGGA
jgi:hypothetical protein